MKLGDVSKIKTGNLDVNAKVENGRYPFFTCAQRPEKIDSYSFDCEGVLVAGNGDLNVKYYKGKFDAYQRTYVVEVLQKNRLDTRFLFHFLNKYLEKLRNLSIGGVIKYIKMANLTDIKLPDYSLDKQKQIVKTLDTADGLRQKRKEQLALLDDYLKSVFLDMFGDPSINDKKWRVMNIRDVSEKFSDGPFGSNLKTEHYQNSGVRVIRLQNIGVGKFNDEDKAFVSKTHHETIKKYTCKPGDILIATMGDPNIRACILPEAISVAINKADCIQMRPKLDLVLAEYICGILNSSSAIYLVTKFLHGQTRTRISMGQLSSLNIPIPPIDLQNEFASIVEQVEQTKQKMRESLDEINNHFNALMQRYFG